MTLHDMAYMHCVYEYTNIELLLQEFVQFLCTLCSTVVPC